MPQGFEFATIQLTVTFYDLAPASGIRQLIQSRVRGTYLPPREFPLPNGSVAYAMQSERGDSNMVINPNDLTVIHNVPKNIKSSVDKVRSLALEDIQLVYSLLSDIGALGQSIYAGVAIVTHIPCASDDEALVSIHRYFEAAYPPSMVDINIRQTFEYASGKYTNINVQNYRNFDRNPVVDPSLLRMDNERATDRGVEVLVDHNTRLSYNRGGTVEIDAASLKTLMREGLKFSEKTSSAVLAIVEANDDVD